MIIFSSPQRVQEHRRRLKNQHPFPPGAETELDIHGIYVEALVKKTKLLNCAR